MIKIAMIGAGSVVFSKNLTGDILTYPLFKQVELAYMDVDPRRLEVSAALCRKVAHAVEAQPIISATTNLRQALDGADFVINMVQIGGFDGTLVDFEIPRKYGLNFTIADTTGPGGLFRALRTYPFLRQLCQTMTDVCPRAWLLNYSNPMSMNMQTICRTSQVPAVGLCHSVQGTLNDIMGYLRIDTGDATFICAGINHMAFYLRLEKEGRDLYPDLFAAMNRPEIHGRNKVRFELMKRLGYFVTESSEHNAEYSPYFIPHGAQQVARFNVPIDEYLRRCDNIVAEFGRLEQLSLDQEPLAVRRSHEYGSTIIHAMCSGTPEVVYGNRPNRGVISNLPGDCIVEVPTLVDRSGLHSVHVGDLPPQLVGYMQPHVTQHELFIRAAVEGRRDHIYQAVMFDPLTAAVLSLDQIVEMCDELIAAHGSALPDLDAKKTLVSGSGKSFGKVDAAELRLRWNQRQADLAKSLIKDWHIIGPFRSPEPGAVSLDLPTPVEADFARDGTGEIDIKSSYSSADQVLQWIPATMQPNGMVNLDPVLGRHEWSVALGYTRIEFENEADATLTCGSDDGIRIWLNGKRVHSHEVGRGYTAHSDRAHVRMQQGVNHLLVKIDNYQGGWGFGVGIHIGCPG